MVTSATGVLPQEGGRKKTTGTNEGLVKRLSGVCQALGSTLRTEGKEELKEGRTKQYF